MKSSVPGFTTAAFAIAATFGLTVAGPHRAYAAPDTAMAPSQSQLSVSVLSPAPRTSFSGNKPVEVAAFYQGTTGNPIASIELLVDGQSAFTKKLDAPEDRGVISFLVDASQLSPGQHRVVVRAVAVDAEIVSAKSSFIYVSDQASTSAAPAQSGTDAITGSADAPNLTFLSPSADQKVTGVVHIEMQTTDAAGQQPYVSLFVDKQFKTLRNYAPYVYDLDTSDLTNGYHTIEVYAYNDEQNVGPAKVLRIYVNNPGGNTSIRTDLNDANTPSTKKPAHRLAVNPGLTDSTPTAAPVHRAVATRPIDKVSAPALVAPRKHAVRTASTAQAPTGRSLKALGPARRPSPRMAMVQKNNPLDQLRAVMMAKRPDLLDQTGGLDLNSQLSDPFIPDTASPRPVAPAQTPTTGFRPMPTAKSNLSASAATSMLKPHTVAVTHAVASPAHIQVAAPIAQPKHVQVAAPVAQPAHVQVAAPVAQPKHVQIAAPIAQPAHVQVAAPIVQPKHVEVAAPVAQPKHVQAVAPIVQPAHVQVAAPVAQPKHIQPAVPLVTEHKHIQYATPALQPRHALAATPVAAPKHVDVIAPVVSPKPLKSVRHIEVRRASALTTVRPAVHFMPIVRRPSTVAVQMPSHNRQARLHMGRFSDVMHSRGRMMVMFNSTRLMMDRPMTIHRGVTFSALRQVFEYQGGTLDWDNKTNTVHAVNGTEDITLHIGSRHAVINHEAVLLKGTPYLASGRTMVPLSFVAEALDANVTTDPATGNLLITSKH